MRVTEFRLQNCVDIEDSGWVVVEGGIAPRPIGRKTWQVLEFLRDVLDSDQPDLDFIHQIRPTSRGEVGRAVTLRFRCTLTSRRLTSYRFNRLDWRGDKVMLRLSLVLCDDPPELQLRTLDVEDGAEDTVLRAISVLPGTSEPPVWFYWSDFFDPNHRSGFNLWQFVHVERQRGFLPFLEHTAEIGEDERLEDLEDGPAFLETQFIVGLVRETVQGFFQHGLETLNVVDETNLALHQRIRLRNVLVHNTSMDELQGWVFDLGLEWENLEGPAKPSRTVALLTELEHRGRLGDLVALVRRDRPDLSF